ncbi:MAG: multidrug MFS transporter [bacterium]|nr:multidrug MFS transporter [bacterium]
MIFLTVGTHEQPFDRAVEAVDALKGKGKITTDVFIQTGYSAYKPRHCQYADFIGFDKMMELMEKAELVITHGGTGSIMLVLYHKKIPLVIPRQKQYGEHIDNHQVHFCKLMESKKKILPAYEVDDLESIIENHKALASELQAHTADETDALSMEERSGIFSQKLLDICAGWERP